MALRALSLGELARILAEVPQEWNNGGVMARISRHLSAVAEHADQFAEEIGRRLA